MESRSMGPLVPLAARWGLPAGGVVLLGVLLYFARTHTASVRVFAGTLAFPVASVGVLGGIGYYIATRELTAGEMITVYKWVALGLAVMGAVVAWYQVLDLVHEHHIPVVILGLATLSIGGAMGALVGWYSVRAKATIREATKAQEREAYLERQRETLALIDRTLRHHLLNGLTIVDAHAQELDRHLDDDGRESLDTIRSQADDMMSTIDDIRTLSEAVYEQDRTDTIDLSETVRGELDSVADAHPDAEFEIDAPDEAVAVRGNRLVSTATANLLHNAVQHNDADTPRVKVTVSRNENSATVAITDNGPGIPPDRRDELFEMGERGEDSSGTGMGLFLAKTVVERLDGRIWIESDAGAGTTVAYELPTAGGGTR